MGEKTKKRIKDLLDERFRILREIRAQEEEQLRLPFDYPEQPDCPSRDSYMYDG